jgi:tRNA-2-methylthio-N6-dimethylallyladenosine synthase
MPASSVYLETFGCQMNELDSELVSGALRTLGYRFVGDADEADVVLYNTCSVREHAEQKVWSRLGELAIRKAREPGLVVGVLGCMAEREGEALLKRMPVVDILVGPGELDKLPALLDNAVRTRQSLLDDEATLSLAATPEGRKPDLSRLTSANQAALQGGASRRSSTLAAAADSLEMLDLSRSISPADHRGSAYVRITRGCNKFCTYCVVPSTRGAEVHRPPQHIIDECKRLADAGVIEVTLLGQTVNHYRFEHDAAEVIDGVVQPQKGRPYTHRRGVYEDPYKAEKGQRVTTFANLLYQIHEQAPAIRRLRFVTSFPRSFGDDILQVIRDCPRICRYLHVPAQSGSDRLLKLMNRGYSVEEYLEFLDRARAALHQPQLGRPLTLAGDIIVGFPTETEDDHAATARLLERARYKNCFIFKYSPRPGTVAIDKFTDDVPDEVKRRRNNELLALQGRISESVGREFIGLTTSVMVEGVSKRDRRKVAPAGSTHAPHTADAAAGTPKGRVGLTIAGRSIDSNAQPPGHGHHHHDHDHRHAGACAVDASSVHPADSTDRPLAEGPSAASPTTGEPIQMSARTDGDLIVFFDLPAGANPDSLIGRIIDVRITDSRPLALMGEAVGPG